jgi:hypothetical protein
LELSEDYISTLFGEETQFGTSPDKVDKIIQYLDSTHTDGELQEYWNSIYDKYGMRIPQMERRWYRDNEIPDIGEVGGVSEPINCKVVEYLNSKKGFKKIYDF